MIEDIKTIVAAKISPLILWLGGVHILSYHFCKGYSPDSYNWSVLGYDELAELVVLCLLGISITFKRYRIRSVIDELGLFLSNKYILASLFLAILFVVFSFFSYVLSVFAIITFFLTLAGFLEVASQAVGELEGKSDLVGGGDPTLREVGLRFLIISSSSTLVFVLTAFMFAVGVLEK